MPGTPTPRHTLPIIAGAADNVSTWPSVYNGAAASLDGSVYVSEGTISARSSVVPAYGDEYFATDTGLWYKWNGSAWQTMLLAGPWVPLVLGSGWVPYTNYSSTTPSGRLIGDQISLKGEIANSSGATSNAPFGAWPVSLRPTVTQTFTPPVYLALPIIVVITPGGSVSAPASWGSGAVIDLNGQSFSTS